MSLEEFHQRVSTASHNFDHGAEDFDVKDVYIHYALKVSLVNLVTILQHERSATTVFMDKWFAEPLKQFAANSADYETLFVKTRRLANMANQKL